MISWGILVRRRPDAQGRERVLQQAALPLHLGGGADEHQGDFGAYDLVPPHDLEIDVRNGMPDRVTLELAGQHQMSRAVYVESEHLVEAVDREGRTQVPGADRYGQRLHTVPIDDARHPAVVPEPPRRARPDRPPNFSDQLNFCHVRSRSAPRFTPPELSRGKGTPHDSPSELQQVTAQPLPLHYSRLVAAIRAQDPLGAAGSGSTDP